MLVLAAHRDRDYSETLGELLRGRSHRVILAPAWTPLRRFLRRAPADVIVVSTTVAEGRPEDMVREIRQLQPSSTIVLLGDLSASEAAACIAAGVDDCVRAPVRPRDLAIRVEALMSPSE